MKTTIDIPDDIYRRVKAKSALGGMAVREVAIGLFRSWVEEGNADVTPRKEVSVTTDGDPAPPWFGCLRKYAGNARGKHDMQSIRRSIARGIALERGL